MPGLILLISHFLSTIDDGVIMSHHPPRVKFKISVDGCVMVI
ncbi:hypothetical protein [Escherichia phage ZCEC13]|uniref:Uncharacterized protein n=1 Tax=Escherichia phage ZCEC13 TaxID=2935866 RepID=A0AAE9HET0_9CAUD|nr:hypothetical protein [Escherichia phage ZCEC13]